MEDYTRKLCTDVKFLEQELKDAQMEPIRHLLRRYPNNELLEKQNRYKFFIQRKKCVHELVTKKFFSVGNEIFDHLVSLLGPDAALEIVIPSWIVSFDVKICIEWKTTITQANDYFHKYVRPDEWPKTVVVSSPDSLSDPVVTVNFIEFDKFSQDLVLHRTSPVNITDFPLLRECFNTYFTTSLDIESVEMQSTDVVVTLTDSLDAYVELEGNINFILPGFIQEASFINYSQGYWLVITKHKFKEMMEIMATPFPLVYPSEAVIRAKMNGRREFSIGGVLDTFSNELDAYEYLWCQHYHDEYVQGVECTFLPRDLIDMIGLYLP